MDEKELECIISNGAVWEYFVGNQSYEEFVGADTIEEAVIDYLKDLPNLTEDNIGLLHEALIDELERWEREQE